MTGFTSLLAPVYSKTLVDEQGRPLKIGTAPLVYDPHCRTTLYYVAEPRRAWRARDLVVGEEIEPETQG